MVNALRVSGLSVGVQGGKRLLDNVSFDLAQGERIGLIGESGSGKSLTAAALTGLLRPPVVSACVSLMLNGQEMRRASPRHWRQLRGDQIFQIFQSPGTALTPARRIGPQLKEAARRAGRGIQTIDMALDMVSLPRSVSGQFPYQLSGGMRQRVLIAMALILRPAVLIADEPTTGLDILTESGILEALNEMVDQSGTALVFISHDLRAVRQVADRVLVLEAGQLVEDGPIAHLGSSTAQAARDLARAAQVLQTSC